MVRLLGHRQTKGAATDNIEPKATAPHLDSTESSRSRTTDSRHLSVRFWEKRPLDISVCPTSRNYCQARHQVVLQAIKRIAYCTAGILWDRFRFANHCVLRHFVSLLTTFCFKRLNPNFYRTLHKIVVLHSESTAIPLIRLRGLGQWT